MRQPIFILLPALGVVGPRKCKGAAAFLPYFGPRQGRGKAATSFSHLLVTTSNFAPRAWRWESPRIRGWHSIWALFWATHKAGVREPLVIFISALGFRDPRECSVDVGFPPYFGPRQDRGEATPSNLASRAWRWGPLRIQGLFWAHKKPRVRQPLLIFLPALGILGPGEGRGEAIISHFALHAWRWGLRGRQGSCSISALFWALNRRWVRPPLLSFLPALGILAPREGGGEAATSDFAPRVSCWGPPRMQG